MNIEATAKLNVPEFNLRCEYSVRVIGRHIEAVRFAGMFDLPNALSDGCLGAYFYQGPVQILLAHLIAKPADAAFTEFAKKHGVADSKNPRPDTAAQTTEPSIPQHEDMRPDDLRLETVIRVYGREVELLSQIGGFAMPGGLQPLILSHYQGIFSELLDRLVIFPALSTVYGFLNNRLQAYRQRTRPEAPKTESLEPSWNFGSENLISEVDELAEQKAA